MKNKHIERIERRRNNVEKKLKVREKRLKGPPISIGPGDHLNVEKLMAKVDEADKYGGVERVKNVIIMIRAVFLTFEREKAKLNTTNTRISKSAYNPIVYDQFVKKLKDIRPNLYSECLEELGVDDFSVSFDNHFKKLLPGKTQNKFLFFLIFPFKLTWLVLTAPFNESLEGSSGKITAQVVMFLIWFLGAAILAQIFSPI